MRRQRNAFTLVETIIVISVIAILAAVLIPTFAGVIKSAKLSNDRALAANLNKMIAVEAGGNSISGPKDLETITDSIMGDGSYSSLAPESAGYGYHFWYDISSMTVILAKTDDIQSKSGESHTGYAGSLIASSEDVSGEEVNPDNGTPAWGEEYNPRCEIREGYFFIDDSGSFLASVVDYLESHADDGTDTMNSCAKGIIASICEDLIKESEAGELTGGAESFADISPEKAEAFDKEVKRAVLSDQELAEKYTELLDIRMTSFRLCLVGDDGEKKAVSGSTVLPGNCNNAAFCADSFVFNDDICFDEWTVSWRIEGTNTDGISIENGKITVAEGANSGLFTVLAVPAGHEDMSCSLSVYLSNIIDCALLFRSCPVTDGNEVVISEADASGVMRFELDTTKGNANVKNGYTYNYGNLISPIGTDLVFESTGTLFTVSADGTVTYCGNGSGRQDIIIYPKGFRSIAKTVTLVMSDEKTYLTASGAPGSVRQIGNENPVTLSDIFTVAGDIPSEFCSVNIDVDFITEESSGERVFSCSVNENGSGVSGMINDTTLNFTGSGIAAIRLSLRKSGDTTDYSTASLVVEVIDGKNIRNANEWSALGNLVLQNDISLDLSVPCDESSYYIKTGGCVYGNGYTIFASHNTISHSEESFPRAVLSLENASLNGTRFEFESGFISKNSDVCIGNETDTVHVINAIRTLGYSCSIENSFISGGRATVQICSEKAYLANTVLSGGSLCNLAIEDAVDVTLDTVTTLQPTNGNSVVGVGIYVECDVNATSPKLTIRNSLTQYNWLRSTTGNDSVPAVLRDCFNSLICDTSSDFLFSAGEEQYINSGIVFRKENSLALSDTLIFENMSGGMYASASVAADKAGTFVSLRRPACNDLTVDTSAYDRLDFVRVRTSVLSPELIFTYGGVRYNDGDTVSLPAAQEETTVIDITGLVACEKYLRSLPYTFSCPGADIDSGKVSFASPGRYALVFNVSDDAIFDGVGRNTGNTAEYTYTVFVLVTGGNLDVEYGNNKLQTGSTVSGTGYSLAIDGCGTNEYIIPLFDSLIIKDGNAVIVSPDSMTVPGNLCISIEAGENGPLFDKFVEYNGHLCITNSEGSNASSVTVTLTYSYNSCDIVSVVFSEFTNLSSNDSIPADGAGEITDGTITGGGNQ